MRALFFSLLLLLLPLCADAEKPLGLAAWPGAPALLALPHGEAVRHVLGTRNRQLGRPAMHVIAVALGIPGKWRRSAAVRATATLDTALKKARHFYGKVHSRVLSGLKGLQAAVDDVVRAARPDDTFLLYFGGALRGPVLAGDARSHKLGADGSGLSASVLGAWLARVPAKYQVVLADSGEPDDRLWKLLGEVAAGERELLELTGRKLAFFSTEGESGLLAKELPRALRAVSTDSDGDGLVTVTELATALGRQLDVRRAKLHSVRIGGEFAIARARFDFRASASRARSLVKRVSTLTSVSSNPPSTTPNPYERGAEPLVQLPTKALLDPHRRDYALFFATDTYEKWSPLSNPVRDAEALASELQRRYGFEVELVRNPTYREARAKLVEYAKRKFGPQDQLFVFFAGHGAYDPLGNEGFVVFKDSPAQAHEGRTFAHHQLRNALDNLRCKHIYLVLDVCFGGTVDPRIAKAGRATERIETVPVATSSPVPSSTRGGAAPAPGPAPAVTAPSPPARVLAARESMRVARTLSRQTRLFATSGGKEYVPDGRPGHHSPFAQALLGTLRGAAKVVTSRSLSSSLQDLEPEPRGGEFGSNEPGSDFVFIPRSAQ